MRRNMRRYFRVGEQTTVADFLLQATFARSEQIIVSNDDICPNVNQDIYAMIRSDFAICSEPTDALDRSCISGVENEKDNCGFR